VRGYQVRRPDRVDDRGVEVVTSFCSRGVPALAARSRRWSTVRRHLRATGIDMAKIFLQHPVADFDKWRPIFDADGPRRDAAGLTNVRLLRDADDPNSVWIVADGDPAKFEEMMKDPELGQAMQDAGVTAPPQVFIAT
jgi:hypothetical protein